MARKKFTHMESAWIRLSMPANHAETTFRLLLRTEIEEHLESNVNVRDILSGVVDSGLIAQAESDVIRKLPSNSVRLKALLKCIHAKSGPGTVEKFLDCLRRQKYDHSALVIHDHLQNIYTAASNANREIQIKCGLVPAQPEFYVVRREMVYQFKDHIISASEKARTTQATQWILLHGMPGNGKSYLAAAALRSPEIWKVCFGDGVFWLDIGKPGTEKLLIKLGVLCQMVTSKTAGPIQQDSFNPPSDVDSVLPRLASAFATQHPNSALVLDDVWDESVIMAFEKVACKCIIVTSRKKDIMKCIKATVTPMEISEGFTEDESEEYFAQILKTSVEKLPEEARLIHREANGSPMVMALVGGMLRDHNNDPRQWQHYLTKLTRTPSSMMKMTGSTTYEYRSINEAISLSVHSLKDDLNEKFFDFAVFDDDVPIPLSVFATLWSIQTEGDAADEMAYFVNCSLCTRDYCPQRDCHLYRFHDLILLYARNHIPIKETPGMLEHEIQLARDKALQEKHRKLFMKYHQACKGKFKDLENDFYIHNFIGYHLSSGKLMSDITVLYADEAFLKKRLAYAGPEVVLVDVLLLAKQHPAFSEQMKKLEVDLRAKYYVTLQSPDVQSNRRSRIFEEFIHSSRRGSEVELDICKVVSPTGRGRSQSIEPSPLKPLSSVHSEPVLRGARSLSRIGQSSQSSSVLEEEESFHENKENGRVNGDQVLPKYRMADLRNDNFDDYV